MLRKYQEVSYLHAKKISNIIITVTKIVPSPTGELSLNKKIFPPGLYKFSDTAWRTRIFIMIKSNLWKHVASQARGVMCHWSMSKTVVTYDKVSMTYFKWPKNGHCDITTMAACSSGYCRGETLWLCNELRFQFSKGSWTISSQQQWQWVVAFKERIPNLSLKPSFLLWI